jgi:hypothetical protein
MNNDPSGNSRFICLWRLALLAIAGLREVVVRHQAVPLMALFRIVFLLLLGFGAWTVQSAEPPSEKVLFEENFTGAPGNGWFWLREIPDHWRIDKERKELLIRPVWATNGLKNTLLRAIPDGNKGPLAIDVHVQHVPQADYEISGLICYFDDDNFVHISRELMGNSKEGEMHLFMGVLKAGQKMPRPISKHVIYKDPGIDLRMVISQKTATGWYRTSATEKWQLLDEVEMPSAAAAKIGFRTGNGEEDKPSWVQFSNFRILQCEP